MDSTPVQGFRLSPQQERLWTLRQPGSDPFRAEAVLSLDGGLDVARLEAALRRLVARHEILRTTFQVLPGMSLPVQVVGEPELELRRREACDRGGDVEAAAAALLNETVPGPATLARGPLLTASLTALCGDRHLLRLGLPALCGDAASLRILAAELAREYGATGGGAVGEAPPQYADLAEWQHELAGAAGAPGAELARAYAAAAEAGGIGLPFERATGDRRPFAPAAFEDVLDQPLAKAVAALGARLSAPSWALLLACWAALLERLTGRADAALGVELPNRKYEELAAAIGPFSKLLPVRLGAAAGRTLADQVAAVRWAVAEAESWQEYFTWAECERSAAAAGTPIHLPFAFAWEPAFAGEPAGGLEVRVLRLRVCNERFKLRLSCREVDGRARCDLAYDAARFERAAIERLAGSFRELLRGALTSPETALDDHEIVAEPERRRLLLELNDTAVEYRREACFHQLFEEQVERTPDLPAAQFGGERLSFRELNARANQLAHHLRRLGVGPEARVGIFMPRALDLLVAVLAVLKAGGAYLPLDPAYPRERLAFLLRDAEVRVVIAADRLAHRLPEHPRLLRLAAERQAVAAESRDNPAGGADPDNLAYVIYTSGSTGQPKGVLVRHRGLVNYATWAVAEYALAAGRGAPVHSSFGFDLTVTSLLCPLLAGRPVVLLPEEEGVTALGAALRASRGFSLLKITPLHLSILAQLLAPEELAGRAGVIVIGGEALTWEALAAWRAHAPRTRLMNEYGPTEAVVGCCVYEVPAAAAAAAGGVPIGRPIANTRLYVADRALRPAPATVPGELLIGGDGVARGYLGRPDLTAERFIPDPWSSRPGERLYRTGDLVRMLQDGTFDYLGRVDRQLKIRGFRIEPAEVEAVLAAHCGVREAVVLASAEAGAERRLVAFWLAAGSPAPAAEALRAFAAERLPSFMVPQLLVALESWPLTPNGKVDRAALCALAARAAAPEMPFVAPRHLLEETLAAIWGEVLGVERVGIHDNFFMLGGDSIRTIEVIAKARERGLELAPQDFFSHPTLGELARLPLLAGAAAPAARRPAAPFALLAPADRARLPESVVDAYPAAMLQAGMLLHSKLRAQTAVYHDISSFHLRGRLDLGVLRAVLQQLLERHPVLRTSFDLAGGGEPLQLVHAAAAADLGIDDLGELDAAGQEAAIGAWMEGEKGRGFDPSVPGLLRFQLHLRGGGEFQLTLSYHHAILDGWSVATLVSELFLHYSALLRGEELALTPPAAAYGDFVALERLAVADPECRDFWLRTLAQSGVAELCRWPLPAARGPRFGRQVVTLPGGLTAALLRLARREGLPLKSVLLAAHAAVLSAATGEQDLVTGMVAHGRLEAADGERVLGLFLNTLPLRLRLAGGSWLDLARQAFAAERDALPFRRYPLAELQRVLGVRKLFETAFNFVNFHLYQALPRGGELELLDGLFFEETSFTLAANFMLDPDAAELRLHLDYDPGEICSAQAQSLAGAFLAALAAIAAAPEARHELCSLLSPAERHQLLREWNDTAPGTPAAASLLELFAAQAGRRPEAPALSFAGEQLTYGELDRRAGRLGRQLRAARAGGEAVVAVCLPRSPVLVVAMLAVLKAGAVYLPLDPAYPRQRLAYMLRDARADLLLSDRALAASLPPQAAARTLLVEDLEAAPAPGGAGGMPAAQDLAYVIYTSGSTGEPKGVMVQHGGLAALAEAQAEAFAVWPHSRVLQFASPSFDASIAELAVAFAAGAELCLASQNAMQPGPPLLRLLREQAITHLTLPPAVLAALPNAELPALRTLIVAGEAASAEVVGHWRGNHVVLNAYGPTETTVCATISGPLDGSVRPPIGRPITGTRTYLLDRHLRPAPVGAPGELFVAGAGLARGYLGRPAATAEKFLPDPFATAPGSRLYRTGDLVRQRPDGALEFLGRADRQIKVRGYRIEPGEIEAALLRHGAVRQAAVVAQPVAGGDRQLVAYVAADPAAAPGVEELRGFLRELLPEFMLPAAFVALEALPLSPNGKVDRRALPPAVPARRGPEEPSAAPQSALERRVAALWQEVLGVERVGRRDNFFDLGGHSLLLIKMHSRLESELGGELPLIELLNHPTVAELAAFLAARRSGPAPPSLAPAAARVPPASGRIAVIAMAGRFPGAADVDQLWRNLCQGVESISFFGPEELRRAGVEEALLERSDYVRAKGVLGGADLFDAGFFGYTPREAEILDPQQRVFLECAWEALESAGYGGESPAGRVGVFAGESMNSYLHNLISNPELLDAVGAVQAITSNDKDFLATRVSYKLNLEGPSVVVQTACSTALVAVHLACRSLLDGESDMALAGGVSVRFPQLSGYSFTEGGIDSPDGHCRAFDAAAAGTVAGNGVGVVVLKRLEEALADGDPVRAVILGSAINNDGARKVGYTAPRVEGQAKAIQAAQAAAGVAAGTIGYVEAHGTGTQLGDPIEIAALGLAFGAAAPKAGSCVLGSVKTNIGHLDAAAGIAGLIKAIHCVERGMVPPSLHFARPNPRIDFAAGPFRVATELTPWAAGASPRRAGVSSFGIGGTNAHLILEEPPPGAPPGQPGEQRLLLLSARTPSALAAATTRLAEHLGQHPDLDADDVAFTLQAGRQHFVQRRALICRDLADAAAALAAGDPQRVLAAVAEPGYRPVAFLLSSQGAQHVDMGRGLYHAEPVFRQALDLCCRLLEPRLGLDLRRVLYPERERAGASRELDRTAMAQPALFAVEYALAQLWLSWGVRPQAMLGHSIGEYAAACLAGVMSLETALEVVAERGRLMQELPAGAMLAVALAPDELRPLLPRDVELAAVNGPEMCVAAGPLAAVRELEQRLAGREVGLRRLHTSHAFHSAMTEAILAPFGELMARVELRPPQIPFVSNLTGTWIQPQEATDPSYWVRHIRHTVRFGDGLAALLGEPDRILLEVGPGNGLATLALRHPRRQLRQLALSSLGHPREQGAESAFLLQALGRLWLAGVPIDWPAVHAGRGRRRVALPTYPFERRRYWIEPGDFATPPPSRAAGVAGWLYTPTWTRSAPPPAPRPEELDAAPWLLFVGAAGGDLGRALAEKLRGAGCAVSTVEAGPRRATLAGGRYVIDPALPGDYRALLEELDAGGRRPGQVVHLWSAAAPRAGEDAGCDLTLCQERGYYSLLHLLRALAELPWTDPLRIRVVASGVLQVTGEETLRPAAATVLGPCLVAPQESPNLACQLIDVPPAGTPDSRRDGRADLLLRELGRRPREAVVAYRGGFRWSRGFTPAGGDRPALARLRPAGVYWITGGLGTVGSALAGELARTAGAKLILTGRTALPAPAEWDGWLAAHGEADPVSRRIRRVRALEAQGAEVWVASADVADGERMAEVVRLAELRFGRIDGVLHAAGTVGAAALRSIGETGAAESAALFRAKVGGCQVLAALFAGRPLDFCLLCSSLSSLLGGLGLAAYAAANAYLDVFAQLQSRNGSSPWISVDWDAWRAAEETGQEAAAERIAPAQGGAALALILGLEASQVAVSVGDLAARLAAAAERLANHGLPAAAAAPGEAAPGHPRPGLANAYVAPRNATERVIAELWQRLLGIAEVGAFDNFFELGGHSLLAAQLISQLRKALPAAPPLRAVFDFPTVAGLAQAAAASAERPRREAPPIVPVGRGPGLPLSFAQQRLYYMQEIDPENPYFNLHVGVRLEGELDAPALAASLAEIVRRHEMLRTTFSGDHAAPLQLVQPAFPPHLPLLDLAGLAAGAQETETRRLASEQQRRPFRLAELPLLRLCLLRLSERRHVLLLTLHHIVWDAWSFGVFIREIQALYPAMAAGRPSPLPALAVQYADFAHWQRGWLRGEVEESLLAYWRRQLAGAPAAIALPAAAPGGEGEGRRGCRLPVQLGAALAQGLGALARREEATPFMALLAGFAICLRHHAQQDDLVIGTDIANRTGAETEALIGFFINQLALRVDLSGGPSTAELLRRVRTMTTAAYEHQDLPFDRLVSALNPRRSASGQPLFQVKLVLQNAPLGAVALSGLSFEFLDAPVDHAQLDLILNLTESAGGFFGTLEYDAGRLEAATAARMVEDLETVFAAMAAAPDQPIGAIEKRLCAGDQSRLRAHGSHHLQQLRQRGAASAPPAEAQLVVARGGDETEAREC